MTECQMLQAAQRLLFASFVLQDNSVFALHFTVRGAVHNLARQTIRQTLDFIQTHQIKLIG